jgi:chromosome segregation ATPase
MFYLILKHLIIFRSNEGDKNIEIQKRDLELNETKKQLVRVELQAQKRSQQIIESKKEIATLQLKIQELEGVRAGYRDKEKRMGRDLAILQEELNRRDARISQLDSEKSRSEELLGTADARLVLAYT